MASSGLNRLNHSAFGWLVLQKVGLKCSLTIHPFKNTSFFIFINDCSQDNVDSGILVTYCFFCVICVCVLIIHTHCSIGINLAVKIARNVSCHSLWMCGICHVWWVMTCLNLHQNHFRLRTHLFDLHWNMYTNFMTLTGVVWWSVVRMLISVCNDSKSDGITTGHFSFCFRGSSDCHQRKPHFSLVNIV